MSSATIKISLTAAAWMTTIFTLEIVQRLLEPSSSLVCPRGQHGARFRRCSPTMLSNSAFAGGVLGSAVSASFLGPQ